MGKTLVCLSGGGFRMLECACGFFKALEAKSMKPDFYMGASAGAIAATLHASGVSGIGLEKIIKSTPTSKLMTKRLWPMFIPFMKTSSVYDRAGMQKLLEKHVDPANSLLKTRVSVTELKTKKTSMLPGDVISAMASSAIPEVFEPVVIDGVGYVDGGVKNNIPLPRFADLGMWERVIILMCPGVEEQSTGWTKTGRSIEWLEATMDREFCQVFETWSGLPQVTLLQPPAPKFETSLLDWSDGFKMIKHCEDYCMEAI